MSSIGPLPELVAHLRTELAALRGAAPVGSALTRAAAQAGQPNVKRAAASRAQATARRQAPPEDLASTIARRVAALDPADPDRRRKAFRVFLESVLLEECGPQLINDPGFYQLVANVHAQMDAQPGLHALMEQAADRLLGASAR